jgi:hypothetical protein
MDLNKFTSLSISNNSPVHRLRKRNVFQIQNVVPKKAARKIKPDGKVKNDSGGISSNSCISSSEISGTSRSTNLNTTYEIDYVINDNLNIGDLSFERNINVACATFNDSCDENDLEESERIVVYSSGSDEDDVVLLDKNVANDNVKSNNKLILTKTQRGCPKLCKIGYYYTIDGPAKSMD